MKYVRQLCLGLGATLALAMAGCQQESAPSPEPEGAATPAPDAKPGLTVRDATLVLPAVAGRPGVAYFALRNGSDSAVSVVAASIQGAGSAEMHETLGGAMAAKESVEVGAGETVTFQQGGKHVMVFDLSDILQEGGTTELTLTFSDGDKLSTPLAIRRMGAAGGAMEGMNHGDGS